jgi:transposase-like protein
VTKVTPIEVTTDKAPVYLGVLDELLPAAWHHTQRHGNNRVECDGAVALRRPGAC